jgi:type I restriction enzyme S subunit
VGWQNKALADVCQIRPPKSEARERVGPNSLVSFVPMEDLGIDRKSLNLTQVKPLSSVIGSYTYFADGDVLLAKITPCFENGKLGIAGGLSNGVGFGSSEFIVFRSGPNLDEEYLYYFLSREDFRREGAERMGGAVGQQRVPKEFIESYIIPLPPFPEQRRIVRILDEAFEAIATAKANAKTNLQNARALFDSYVESVFARRGEGWTEKLLEEVCLIGDGNHSSNYPKKHEFVVDGIPFIRATNLVNGHISGADMRFISPEKHAQLKKGHLRAGDVLFTNRGEIGKTAIVDQAFDNANLNSQIAWFRCRNEIDNRFLFRALNSRQIRTFFLSEMNGAALQQFTIRQLRQLMIPLPPRNEQQKLVKRIDAISEETQRLESCYTSKLAALEALKKSLLQQAFNGDI